MHSLLGFPQEKRLETILLHFIGFGALININLYCKKQYKSSQKMKNPAKQMLSIIDLKLINNSNCKDGDSYATVINRIDLDHNQYPLRD